MDADCYGPGGRQELVKEFPTEKKQGGRIGEASPGLFEPGLRMKHASTWLLAGGLAVLVCLSVYLAHTRIYQVDECNELIVAKIVADGQAKAYEGSIGLLQFPLAWAAQGAVRSVDYFVSGRRVMVGVFWLNLILVALGTGEKLLSHRGLMALLGAATLAPLWDYGFEVRHDNLLLTGLLLIWCVVRIWPMGMLSWLLVGAISVALQFAAHKAFVYVIPLSLAMLVVPPPGCVAARWKLGLGWIVGGLGMVLVLRLFYGAYGATGLWTVHRHSIEFVSSVATGSDRFGPGISLSRLLAQTPLLLALVAAGVVGVLADMRRRGRGALAWDRTLPEGVLLAIAFAALIVNPTPFPYNLLNLVPFAFLFAYKQGLTIAQAVGRDRVLLPLMWGVLIFVHLVPFWVATYRHWNWSNARQRQLIRLAEELTDPREDPVFDGIGMVLTRPTIGPRALIHSLTLNSLLHGTGPQVRDMLAARPAAVFIPNYRTDWLPPSDQAAVGERYVPLADDFWVLGKVLPAGGGSFQIFHAGRYRIDSLRGSGVAVDAGGGWETVLAPAEAGKFTATLDGAPASDQPVELGLGTHRIECPSGVSPAVVWVGPRLDQVVGLTQSDHKSLFVNWY